MSNHPVRLLRKSKKVFLFGCESTNVSTGRPVESCVSVSVERSDKDKDADENVDADQISRVRPVKSGQSTGIATCSCETNRKLPCSRTREEDLESSSSRSTSSRLAAK